MTTDLNEEGEPNDLDDDGTILASKVRSAGIVRIASGPWDNVFGGGLGNQSTALLGGMPGDGKSTLCFQLCGNVARTYNREVLYFGVEQSKEEYAELIKRVASDQLDRIRLLPLGSQGIVTEIIANRKPLVTVIDSLTALTSNLDEQVEFAKAIKRVAVRYRIPIIIVSQVNKNEDFAGLNKLKHEVDALYMLNKFEHEGVWVRELIPEKNRLGKTDVRCYMTMTDTGLEVMGGLEDDG